MSGSIAIAIAIAIGSMMVEILIVIVHVDPSDFGHDGIPPNAHVLVIIDTIHPYRGGILFAVGAGYECGFESEMVRAGHGEAPPSP